MAEDARAPADVIRALARGVRRRALRSYACPSARPPYVRALPHPPSHAKVPPCARRPEAARERAAARTSTGAGGGPGRGRESGPVPAGPRPPRRSRGALPGQPPTVMAKTWAVPDALVTGSVTDATVFDASSGTFTEKTYAFTVSFPPLPVFR